MNRKKIRFIAVGSANTLLDLTLYSILTTIGLEFFIANLISTSAGMVLSFSLNRTFTFQSTSTHYARQIAPFLLVTLFGLWVIHPVIIYFLSPQVHAYFTALPPFMLNLIPKGVAIAVSLIWNYIWYEKVVFKNPTK